MDDARKMTREEAIEQEPCEDAISRQAVLEVIKNLYPDMPVMDIMGARRKWLEKFAPYFECENAIEQLPPVTPQPKTGHWIMTPHGPKCSKCLIVHSHTSIFCPSCGAKMVEQETKINEDISKGFEEFTRMMFKQGQAESEE